MCAAGVAGASGLWLDVPYIHQEKDGCGSASLAMVLRYWQSKNVPVTAERADPAKIQRDLYSAKPRGIFASEMEKYLRDSGFDVFAFGGEWSDLRSQVAKGRPLIAGLKPKGAPAHYVVIVGVDPEDAAALVNDPERGRLLRIGRAEFEKAWRGTGNWTLLAVPHHAE
jgi:ABC-type bacteriocin/lantibiotic exporter with double-glycine peptidase domain